MTTCLHSKFNEQLKGGIGFEHSPFQNTRENGIWGSISSLNMSSTNEFRVKRKRENLI